MLNHLFRRLTAEPQRGAPLFDSVTAEARRPHWYVEGQVPDTLDGRFAVLATLLALVIVRLEADGGEGDRISVAVTERFIEVMESEHRELGLGDPTLGKTVRKLVASLARRTQIWREAAADERAWTQAARESLSMADGPDAAAEHAASALRRHWEQLGQASLGDLEQGRIS